MKRILQRDLTGEDTQLWCLGLLLVHRRPLSAAERAEIRSYSRGRWRFAWFTLLLLPLLFAVFLAAIAINRTLIDSLPADLGVFAFIIGLTAIAALFLVTKEAFGRRRLTLRDLECNEVLVFSNRDEIAVQMVDATNVENSERTAEVLSGSGRLWSVQSCRTSDWRIVETLSAGKTPESALEHYDQIRSFPDGATQRDFSLAESKELKQYIKRLWTKPLPLVTGLTLWAGVAAFALITSPSHPMSLGDKMSASALLILGICLDIFYCVRVRHALRLRADLRTGVIQAIVGQDDFIDENGIAASRTTSLERLPVSGMIWAFNGHPLGWRLTSPD